MHERVCVTLPVHESLWRTFAAFREGEGNKSRVDFFFFKYNLLGMNAACVSYCDMTSMDSYYSTSTAQGRDHQANPFRTFPTTETKYSPTFIAGKGQPYVEKSRSPFQQECQSLDGAEEGTFNKYQLFMQRPSCKTPPEGSKLHSDSGLNGALVPCYGECKNNGTKSRTEICDTEGHTVRENAPLYGVAYL